MIDWTKRTITGRSGKIYYIRPESINVGRWNEFLLQSATIGFNCDWEYLYKSYNEILTLLTSGNDILGGISKAINICRKVIGELRNFSAGDPNKHIRYAALFCNSDDEDVNVYDEALIRAKANDWNHIPMADFFLLSAEVTPLLKENLQSVFKEEKG